MTLTSFSFFAFLLIGLLVYYMSGKGQKYVLLAMSLFFYFAIAPATLRYRLKLCAIVFYVVFLTYVGGLLIDRAKGKRRTILTFFCIGGLAAVLFVTKYFYNIFTGIAGLFGNPGAFEWLNFGSVIGVSYFILSAIGYLTDVCWESYPAEKNPVNIGVFVLYFPQVISGPVTRFSQMNSQFCEKTGFDPDRISHGIRRMLWGYFKKLVISDRFFLIVNAVYGDYTAYSGWQIFLATVCYALRLYTDFSGCMDIVMGASELFGVSLPENFNAPFFSATVQEFWQRWHITLGGWFKDYVMYPLQKTKGMIELGKKCKKRFGKKAGKKIPFYLAMVVLWFGIGLWHGGAGYYFIASAGIPFLLMLLGDVLSPLFEKVSNALHIRKESGIFKTVCFLRTNLLLCFAWVFVCAGATGRGFRILGHQASHLLTGERSVLGNTTLQALDLCLMFGGMAVVLFADYLQYKGKSLTDLLDAKPFALRFLAVNAEILVILFYGLVGSSAFIYFQF